MNFTSNTSTQQSLSFAWERASLDDFFRKEFQFSSLSPDKICDFRIKRLFWFYKKLIVYVIDDRSSIGKWRRVRKLESKTKAFARSRRVNEVIEMLRLQKEKFDSLGHRDKGWFCQY
ncbi:hypothetical protein [Roseivirga sp. E12]|uniref:hypothetical protein n=1 Tax=Roseivirga sp. E12 TaxID=2819237 RepID=UPI001ABC962C|nr:hypothetical protein [Roseivirga sp. E12]MBO3699810.1 hypothetical protein [Roseivirga sp. E12]